LSGPVTASCRGVGTEICSWLSLPSRRGPFRFDSTVSICYQRCMGFRPLPVKIAARDVLKDAADKFLSTWLSVNPNLYVLSCAGADSLSVILCTAAPFASIYFLKVNCNCVEWTPIPRSNCNLNEGPKGVDPGELATHSGARRTNALITAFGWRRLTLWRWRPRPCPQNRPERNLAPDKQSFLRGPGR
jgi:hypothetical protein